MTTAERSSRSRHNQNPSFRRTLQVTECPFTSALCVGVIGRNAKLAVDTRTNAIIQPLATHEKNPLPRLALERVYLLWVPH